MVHSEVVSDRDQEDNVDLWIVKNLADSAKSLQINEEKGFDIFTALTVLCRLLAFSEDDIRE